MKKNKFDNFLTIDEKILLRAVANYNGKDYSSLINAIRYYNYLDNVADEIYNDLLPEFLERIGKV